VRAERWLIQKLALAERVNAFAAMPAGEIGRATGMCVKWLSPSARSHPGLRPRRRLLVLEVALHGHRTDDSSEFAKRMKWS
jgi:hypothetical protein